jgi:hypothetical protein
MSFSDTDFIILIIFINVILESHISFLHMKNIFDFHSDHEFLQIYNRLFKRTLKLCIIQDTSLAAQGIWVMISNNV